MKQHLVMLLAAMCVACLATPPGHADERPNFLFCIADDWGWPHAGAYGDPVVKTPAFDRLAKEGVLIHHAYISSPSCTPSRGAILTGQFHWRLDGAANLWSVFPDRFDVFPEILKDNGYEIGHIGKAWGPGRTETGGRLLTGKRYRNFQQFIDQRDKTKPFCFWLGSSDPHRPYKLGSGKASGMDLAKIKLPGCFPDSEMVRGDVADYYFEVQRFDSLVGGAIKSLEEAGLLDNTLVAMTGDHGMPFPRCKSTLYDSGARVPLAIRWPKAGKPGRQVQDFVSLTDIAPTFLEMAGVDIPKDITGRSLLPILSSDKSGQVTQDRTYVLFGKERHVPGQEKPSLAGYPCRAIRTHDYLYIINYKPDRWFAGTPHYEKATLPGAWYADCDNGPTKTYMVDNKDKDDTHRKLFDAAFGKKPLVELYDVGKDPDQLNNLAGDPKLVGVQKELSTKLTKHLEATADPRVVGGGDKFDEFPYLGGGPKHPDWKRKK